MDPKEAPLVLAIPPYTSIGTCRALFRREARLKWTSSMTFSTLQSLITFLWMFIHLTSAVTGDWETSNPLPISYYSNATEKQLHGSSHWRALKTRGIQSAKVFWSFKISMGSCYLMTWNSEIAVIFKELSRICRILFICESCKMNF